MNSETSEPQIGTARTGTAGTEPHRFRFRFTETVRKRTGAMLVFVVLCCYGQPFSSSNSLPQAGTLRNGQPES